MFPILSSTILNRTIWAITALLFILNSCATHSIQTGSQADFAEGDSQNDAQIAHTFFLVGDAGDTTYPYARHTLDLLRTAVKETDENSTLLFLGDNIYRDGMPAAKSHPDRAEAETKLKLQMQVSAAFKGTTVFIPGNHDWYSGLDGLLAQGEFVSEHLGQKKSFLPRKGCGIETLKINNHVGLIVLDSEWFLQDWDKHPTMNDDCDFRTRTEFLDELKSEINKNQNKFTIIAMHHPLRSYGPHGGVFSAKKHLYPINNGVPMPIVGSLINFLRKTTGASPQDMQNRQYRALVDHIMPMVQNRDNVLVVSGHDHNLQYIEYDGLKQVISGSASKREAAKAMGKNGFSFGGFGFAKLDIYKDQSALLHFFSTESDTLQKIHEVVIPAPFSESLPNGFEENPAQYVSASIYSNQKPKSAFYEFLWGKHYRGYYHTEILAKSVKLDTLYGGLTPSISGGGTQSESLRLRDAGGKEYVMRALKKNATRFLQSVFRDQNAVVAFQDTYAEQFILDFYTTAHPFTPFIIDDLAEAVRVFHSNPKLFYVPKQPRLGKYNAVFGNRLYMIEERQTDEHIGLESYGFPQRILGTDDVLKNLRKDEKYEVDEVSFIRARLLDMLIGDWDRHQDQWRWSEFSVGDKIIYKPIPRDRDQAFSNVDGALIRLLVKIPGVRHITPFEATYPSEKWFNFSGYPLDAAFIKQADWEVWKTQAKFLVTELSEERIAQAFAKLPAEIRDDHTTREIKRALALRKQHLEAFALKYYALLQKKVVLAGTDKKDKFLIERLSSDRTKITSIRMKKSGEEFQFSRTYNGNETREIWVYGLDDDDVFQVTGSEKSSITLRLIGGQNHDLYHVENGRGVKIYDYKSKKNTIESRNGAAVYFKDDYQTNEYHYKKPKFSHTFLLPMLGYNPDDGVKIGGRFTYLHQGFKSPFTSKHGIGANYYFATGGVELSYHGSFTKAVGNMNLELDALYTSPNFAVNYFGYGNETQNADSRLGRNYNRVRVQTTRFSPALQYIGRFGSQITLRATFENIDVERTPNRFIAAPGAINPRVSEDQQFGGLSFNYTFEITIENQTPP